MSFELSKLLLSHSTDTIGTTCADCKDLPAEVKKKKFKKWKKGKELFYMNEEQMLWLHIGEIKNMFLSACVNDGTVLVKRAGEDKEIPHVVDFYKQHMGGAGGAGW